jgi:hypothetical protein
MIHKLVQKSPFHSEKVWLLASDLGYTRSDIFFREGVVMEAVRSEDIDTES